MWLATTTSKASSWNGRAWTSQARASARSTFSSGATIRRGAPTLPPEGAGRGERDVGQERADVGPQVARPAPSLEHVGVFGPVHPRHQPPKPGLVGPRVLRVQCNPDVEVARVLVLRLAQVLLIGGESVARCGHDALRRRGMRPCPRGCLRWAPPSMSPGTSG